MKILQISHYNHIVGGSDAVFFATCKLLEQAGHEVIRFCMAHPNNEPDANKQFFPEGADTKTAPFHDSFRYFYNGDARRSLRKLLNETGPVDLAHLHIYHGKQTPAILPVLRKAGIPVVQTLHEYKLACPTYTMLRDDRPCDSCITGSPFNAIRHRCKDGSLIRSAVMTAEMATARLFGDVRLIDRFLCVSDFQKNIMLRAGIPPEKLHRLYNFADIGTDSPDKGHGGYLLYFGRIELLKGVKTLIDAAKQTGTKLKIAGTGNWQPEMLEQIKDCPSIECVGFQSGERLRKLVAHATAVVVPSQWYENCPMSVLEAKAQGRPVIGADIGGIPELVRDGLDGFLFRPGDRKSLVSALNKIQRADHRRMSNAALADARLRFSSQRHLDQLASHYRDLIELHQLAKDRVGEPRPHAVN